MHDKPVEVHSGRTRRRWLISAACGLVSILTFLFVLYQACSVKAFAESLNDARRAADSLAVGPDMSREKELALMGDSLLLIEGKLLESEPPESIAAAEELSLLCNDAMQRDAAAYRQQQTIAQAQKRAASTPGMVGVLIIPDVGINVPLMYFDIATGSAGAQALADRPDCCAYIDCLILGANVLADHNNQGFATLHQVRVGTKGYIVTATGIINIQATTVMNGHNNGKIVDENMVPLGPITPYIAYTCRDSWENIRIVGFDAI